MAPPDPTIQAVCFFFIERKYFPPDLTKSKILQDLIEPITVEPVRQVFWYLHLRFPSSVQTVEIK
jgi:hypothetical protein